MRKAYVGKAGKIKVYGTNPAKYFDTLLEKNVNARKGYDEEKGKKCRTLKVEGEKV
jgi:hypothetical protein